MLLAEILRGEKKGGEERARTRIVEKRNIRVAGATPLLEIEGPGRLRELVLVSGSGGAVATLWVDGAPVLRGRIDSLKAESPLVSHIDVFPRRGRWVLRVGETGFSRGLRLVVEGDAVVEKLYAVYEEWLA